MNFLLSYSGKHRLIFLSGIFATISLLGIGQDFINSRLNYNAFYLSESSLYKIGWLLFVPLLLLGFYFFQKVERPFSRFDPRLQILFFSTAFSCLHLCLTAVAIHILSSVFLDHTYAPFQVLRYFFAEHLYLILLIYGLGFNFWRFARRPRQAPQTPSEAPPRPFLEVSSGSRIVPVPIKDILYLESDRPYIAIVTQETRYLHSASLTRMLPLISSAGFARVHRSAIVNIHHVAYLESRSNGDYDLYMTNGDIVRMSRNYSANFKNRMNNPLTTRPADHSG